jgi:Abortive infection alpha
MNEVPDPTGGWARATEATAKASKEAIQAGRDLGRFISGPAGEVVGMLWDHLKVVRFERQVRLSERVRHFLAERGLGGPNRTIPLKIGLPLLDHATLEEDDELQDLWARLLVNGGDANSGIEIRRAFVTVLAEMTALDVRSLALIEHASQSNAESASTGVWTYRLPEAALPFVQGSGRHEEMPSSDVTLSLSNLRRLGCIEPGSQTYQMVELTPFGRALVWACTYQGKP